MRLTIHALVLVCSLAPLASAQPKPAAAITPEARVAADDAFQRQDWREAVRRYEAIVAVEGQNFPARGRLGHSLLELDRLREALPHLEAAVANVPAPKLAFQLARAHARLGDEAKAYAALHKMVAAGGIATATLAGERDFAKLAVQPRFKQVIAENGVALAPCRTGPERRQFDFWIGEWNVVDANGSPAGTSTIQSILDGCTLLENWTSIGGNGGKSFNVYDRNDKKWHQTWVDDKGTFTHYIGGLVDGKMVVVHEQIAGGAKTLARMTFTKLPDGAVRQLGEKSTNGGTSWTVTFDLVYRRRK